MERLCLSLMKTSESILCLRSSVNKISVAELPPIHIQYNKEKFPDEKTN